MSKLNSLLELILDWGFIVFIQLVANDSGALPFANQKGKRGELQWQTLWKYEQLFLTFKQLVEHER